MLKVRRFVIVFLVSIMCLLIAPFHVYAFSISQSNVKGVNYSIVDIIPTNEQYQQNGNTYVKCAFIHRFEVVFDQQFLGYITGQLSGNYQAYNSTGTFTSYNAQSGSRSFYISGYSFEYYLETFAYMMINQIDNYSNTYSATFNLAGSNVTNIDYTARMLEDIEDILYNAENIYTSVYDADNGTVIEQLVDVNEELDFINEMVYYINNNVANIENDTDILSRIRQFNVPIFSWGIVVPSLNVFDLVEYNNNKNISYFDYPAFVIPNAYLDNYFCSGWTLVGEKFTLIYAIGGNLSVDQVITTDANSTNADIKKEILYIYRADDNSLPLWNQGIRVFKIEITAKQNKSFYVKINNDTGSDVLFVPILAGANVEKYVTDDFRQQFGLVDKSHEEYLDDSTSHMQDEFNDMFDYEDDFNNDMNTALQNINVNFDVGNQLGSKFLASADWVRQQYNTLTSNTPFGTVLSFSLLLGLALLIIGKAVR